MVNNNNMNFEVNSKYESERPGDVIFDSEKCRSILERGRHYEPNLGEIIIDTGDLEIENINNPYEETIANGVIDHHRIDNLFKNRDNFQNVQLK